MTTALIRQQIADARAHPHGLDVLRGILEQLGAGGPDDPAVEELASQLTDYVEGAPDLIDACEVAAEAAGIAPIVAPILAAAARYFVEPVDVIPDTHGVFGLLDDAYLARALLAQVSTLHQRETGVPLLPFDLGGQNRIIRAFLGEPAARRLDALVESTVRDAILQHLAALAAHRQTLGIDPSSLTGGPGSWGGAWEDEMTRVAAECGISIDW